MKLRRLLEDLGFVQDYSAMTDQRPGYYFDFGNMRLNAVEVLSKSFRPVMLFNGFEKTDRTVRQVNFELPLELESFEQGVALIVYYLGKEFIPSIATAWISQGREFEDALPWKKQI